MIVLCIVLAFAAGGSAKVFASTGSLVALALAIVLSIVCVLAVVWYMIRERGLL